MMILVAVVALGFGIANEVKTIRRAAKYRRIALYYEEMVDRCQRIDAMDPATRAREDERAWDDPYLHNPEWTHRMIPYYKMLRWIFEDAAAHPRRPRPAVPPAPLW